MNARENIVDLQINGDQTAHFTFPTHGYGLKTYSVILQYSYQGNTKNIASTSFTVIDGTPPVVNIISPVSDSYYNSGFDIVVTATDNASGVDRVEYQIDGGVWKLLPISDPPSGRYSTIWKPTKVDEGAHTISFRAIDKAGNTSLPVSTTLTIDLTPPVANAGQDQNVITGETVTLNGSESYDPEGTMITLLWRFVEVPAGSSVSDVSLSDVTSAKPTFTQMSMEHIGLSLRLVIVYLQILMM
jgi:hypothetical protein